jgi:hypothetical protein
LVLVWLVVSGVEPIVWIVILFKFFLGLYRAVERVMHRLFFSKSFLRSWLLLIWVQRFFRRLLGSLLLDSKESLLREKTDLQRYMAFQFFLQIHSASESRWDWFPHFVLRFYSFYLLWMQWVCTSTLDVPYNTAFFVVLELRWSEFNSLSWLVVVKIVICIVVNSFWGVI